MKKIIIMSLALFAFALVGCGKDGSEEDENKKKEEECKKDTTKQWNDEKKACENKEAGTTPEVTADYTIKNLLAAAVTVSAEGKQDVSLAQNECVKVKGDAAKVKVAEGENVLCDSSDADTANDCAAKNQEVKETKAADDSTTPATPAENGLADAAAMAENCKEMADAAAQ